MKKPKLFTSINDGKVIIAVNGHSVIVSPELAEDFAEAIKRQIRLCWLGYVEESGRRKVSSKKSS
jgi:hypothetical protein